MGANGSPSQDLISLDYGLCLAEAVGEGGIPEPELASLPQAGEAWEALTRLREGKEDCFLHLPYRQEEELRRIEAFADASRGRYDDVVVVGIGGSSLGPQAVFDALRGWPHNADGPRLTGWPRLWFLDTTDPVETRALVGRLQPDRTLYLIISKSGRTLETAAHLAVLGRYYAQQLGRSNLPLHLAVVTDPASGPLRELAVREGYPLFPIPPGVGGRFSVLSPVGLLPLALCGIDPRQLLGGAAAADSRCQGSDPRRNPALMLASLLFLLHRDRGVATAVMMPYRSSLRTAGLWYRQLVAESLGKKAGGARRGITPAVSVGTADQHSQLQLYMEGPADKVLLFLAVEDHGATLTVPEKDPLPGFEWLAGAEYGRLLNLACSATAAALAGEGRPSLTLTLPRADAFTLGQLLWQLMVATACLGTMLGVDPFDQPGVEEGKRNLAALVGKPGTGERRERLAHLLEGKRRTVR